MIEIRRVQGEEMLDTSVPLREYAFSPSPRTVDLDELRRGWAYQKESHTLVLFDDGRPMAAASVVPMTQNVRGRVLAMAGVAGVASHPEGRRRGYQRRLLARLLADRAETGDAVSCLYPFRESFYERLGYAGLPQLRTVTVHPEQLAPLLRRDLPGSVRLQRIGTGFDEFRRLLRDLQTRVHGLAVRNDNNAARMRDRDDLWVALAYGDDGVVAGAMTYAITGFTEELRAGTLLYRGAAERYLLLQWLARHTDQVGTARILVPVSEPVDDWFTDLRPQVRSREDYPAPMGRVLSITGLAGIGAGDGEFTAAVHDATCPWNDGTYRFRGEGGVLSVQPVTEAQTRCVLTIAGLSALVFSGYDPAELTYRAWGDVPAELWASIRAVFPPVSPYLHEEF